MTHLVFGTGLVGGFIAGRLLQKGFETRLIGREKHRVAMRDGLRLSALNTSDEAQVSPQFWLPLDKGTFDYIWLTVKCTSVDSCIEQLKDLIHSKSIIICCQNGFGSDQRLRAELPNTVILNAVIGFNIAETSPSHLHRSTDGKFVVESHTATDAIVKALNCALLPTKSSDNILAERWAKLQLNLSNSVNALADIPTKAMIENAGYRKIITALMQEMLSVTEQMQLPLPKLTAVPAAWLPIVMSAPNWLYLRLAQKMLAIDPTARQSMWWDLSQGKTSEIMYLNQAVVEQGKLQGLECPINQEIVKLVKAVERDDASIGFSPEELVERLKL